MAWRRFLTRVLTLGLGASLLFFVAPAAASASSYWAGIQPESVTNYGIQGTIAYGNPNTDDDSMEWVMSFNSLTSNIWAQAGWRKFQFWAGPEQWAEFSGPAGYVDYYSNTYIDPAEKVLRISGKS